MFIRDAAPADLDIVVAFNLALARETENRELDAVTLRAGVAALLSDRAKGRYFLLEDETRVIGQTMITYEWSDWRNGNFWWIQSVYVAPEHRGRGAFGRLYRHVLDEARRAEDVSGIRLYVDRENHHAATVYRALGMNDAHYDMLEVDFRLARRG